MSLQVWLPLNGDLHNQGLSDITVTNNGATVDNNGKIGKCYYFNGTSAYMPTSYSTAIGTSDFSIAMWIKIPTLTSGTYYAICTSKTTAAASSGFGIYWNYSQKKFLWSTADGSNATEIWMANAVDNIVYDKWIYLVMIRNNNDPKKGYFYINGVRYELASIPVIRNITTNTQLYLGRCTGGSYLAKMYLNDFRIYDHALSAKEVEEIAKGLVLHYKLDDTYSESTTNLLAGQNLSAAGLTVTTTSTYSNNILIVTTTSRIGSYTFDTFRISIPQSILTSGTQYALSFKYKILSGDGDLNLERCDWCDSNFVNINKKIYLDGYEVKLKCPIKNYDNTYHFFDVYMTAPNTQIQFWDFQLEAKDHVTPYVNGTRTSTTIYDSSGYGNNGTIIGSLTTSTPSPRYNYVTHFTATTSKILIENLNTSGFANSYSFTWWGKINTFSNKMFWGFADGVRLNGIYNGNLWNTGDGASNPLYTPGTTTQVTAPSLNTWHHFAMVGNGTMCVVYLDGELWGQAKTYKSISGTKIYMNGWNSDTSYTTNDMSISDFRIYATALTPEQIKELYNTSMSIDNNGNIHARELVEL